MTKKPFVLGLSFALLIIFGVPGTFATEAASQHELVCEKTEHTHTDMCYTVSETPNCGLEEGDGVHTHDESCYEEQSVLTCSLAEDENHTHEDACYTVERVLVCGQQESVGHIHDADCYAKELTCVLEEHIHSKECYQEISSEEIDQPEVSTPVCSCGSTSDVHAEDCPLYKAPVKPNCSCGGEDGTHLEGCPLYKAPAKPGCTCGTENDVHADDCPLYTTPETQEHIEGCTDDCTMEGCTCPCHNKANLFQQLMDCETLEEFWNLLEGYTDEELKVLLDDEKFLQLNKKLDSLLPPSAPQVIMEEDVDNGSSDQMEDSKVIYPTVNYSNVAPFGEPVIG